MRSGAQGLRLSARLPRLAWVFAAILAALPAHLAFASAFGPSDNKAGNPPLYQDCTLCHLDFPRNSGDGGLELLNLPSSFVPGNSYDLFVRIYDPGQSRWGFELTVMNAAAQQGGDLIVLDPVNTQLSDHPGAAADFLKHTFAGTSWGTPDGPVLWSFRWVAPNEPSVTFYFAGNAADGTEDPGNDYIYVRQAVVNQAPTAVAGSSWGQVKALFR
jgi:hypothetical protein